MNKASSPREDAGLAERRGGFVLRFVPWLLGLAATTQLFEIFDVEHGRERFVLLAALALLCFALAPLVARRSASRLISRALSGGLLLVVVLGAIANLIPAGRVAMDVAREGNSRLYDMARANYRAIQLLGRGRNPWGRGEPVDTISMEAAYDRARLDGCIRGTTEETHERALQDWTAFRRVDVETLVSRGGDAARCEGASDLLQYTGLKYGPGMVASYAPFVLVFGALGVPASNLAFFVGILACVAWLSRRLTPSTGLGVLSAMALLVVPTPSMRCTLVDLDCDNAPTFFALLGLVLLELRRDRSGALCLAASVATKVFPGVLFLPLLLRCGPRSWPWFLVGLSSLVLPFAVWDPAGLSHNLLLVSLTRSPDSTALAFFVPQWAWVGLLAAGAASLVVLVRWAHRQGWGADVSVRYLLAATLVALGAGKVLHTNYLVWLQPLLGLYACMTVRAPPALGAADR